MKKFMMKNETGYEFNVVPSYDYKLLKPCYKIECYDPWSKRTDNVVLMPYFIDLPLFESFIHAVAFLKDNINELF